MPMKARDMVMDFFNYTLYIGSIAFFLIYFVAGDRMYIIYAIIKASVPLIIFGIFFIIKLQLNSKKIKELREEKDYKKVLVYLTPKIKMLDKMITILLPGVIIISSLLCRNFNATDTMQALLVFSIVFFTHRILFKKDNIINVAYLTEIDKLIDEITFFSLPIIIIVLAIANNTINALDSFQAFFVFVIQYFWHNYLFKKEE